MEIVSTKTRSFSAFISFSFSLLLHCAQCIVIGPVCGFVTAAGRWRNLTTASARSACVSLCAFYCVFAASSNPTQFAMTRHSLFVLNVLLNTNQTTNCNLVLPALPETTTRPLQHEQILIGSSRTLTDGRMDRQTYRWIFMGKMHAYLMLIHVVSRHLQCHNGLISWFLSSTCTEVSGVENIGQYGRLSQLSWLLGAL